MKKLTYEYLHTGDKTLAKMLIETMTVLTASEYKVYYFLVMKLYHDGFAKATNDHIADRTSFSKKTVNRAIKSLTEKGYLKANGRATRTEANSYTLYRNRREL